MQEKVQVLFGADELGVAKDNIQIEEIKKEDEPTYENIHTQNDPAKIFMAGLEFVADKFGMCCCSTYGANCAI